MRAVEELEEVVVDPELVEATSERLGAEVEVDVVALAGVDVDRLLRPQRVCVARSHSHGVPGEPALPDFGNELAGERLVGEVNRPGLVGRVTRGPAPGAQESVVRLLLARRPGAEVLPAAGGRD